MDTDESSSDAVPRSFVDARTFLPRLAGFCSRDTTERGDGERELQYLKDTLDHYQEAPHLLEQHLSDLTQPAVEAFRSARLSEADGSAALYSSYLYWLSKVVTPKLLVRYFPHDAKDLTFLLEQVNNAQFKTQSWESRYVILLWLSLVVSIPFALDKFATSRSSSLAVLHGNADNESQSGIIRADQVILSTIATWIRATGKERDAAALLAARFFARTDVIATHLEPFLDSCEAEIRSDSEHDFLNTGVLQFLCHFAESASRTSYPDYLLPRMYRMVALFDPASGSSNIRNSPLVRRLCAKYSARLAGAYLPPRASVRSRIALPTLLAGHTVFASGTPDQPEDMAHFDVPAEVETLTGDLLDLLADSDSRVRWTVSKGISRIAERLPAAYLEQIYSTIIDQYRVSLAKIRDSDSFDLSLVSASTWHGCTLCLASLLRADLLTSPQVTEAVPWLLRALSFRQRKGAQKIGSSIRDAACYFFWCLARVAGARTTSVAPESNRYLSRSQIEAVAVGLVLTACTDEEVSVRRAASAAYQELVGRLPDVPDGLVVLVAIESTVVGSQRQAYLQASPAVARYLSYRQPLIEHLYQVGLRRDAIGVRSLAATSLTAILRDEPDPEIIGSLLHQSTQTLKACKDSHTADGHLAFLNELVETDLCEEHFLLQILSAVRQLPPTLLAGSAIPLLLPQIARSISNTLSRLPASEELEKLLDEQSTWRRVIAVAMRRPEGTCHEAAALIVKWASAKTLKNSTSIVAQQCVTRILGDFDFGPSSSCQQLLDITIDRLTKFTKPSSTPPYKSIEAKENALSSLGQICARHLETSHIDRDDVLAVLKRGLDDYTTDERGDVGAKIRMICMIRLVDLILAARSIHDLRDSVREYVTAMLIKQSVERLDSVREIAGKQLVRLAPLYQPFDYEILEHWRTVQDVLPHVLGFFYFSTHRRLIIASIATTVGGSFGVPAVGTSIFLDWVSKLPVAFTCNTYNVARLLRDLIDVATEPIVPNRVLVPTLQAFAVIVEQREWLQRVSKLEHCYERLQEVCWIAGDSVARSRVPARVQASIRILIALCEAEGGLFERASEHLLSLRCRGDPIINDLLLEYSVNSSLHVRQLCVRASSPPSPTMHNL